MRLADLGLAGVDGCLSGGELPVPGRTPSRSSTHIQGSYGPMCSQDANILCLPTSPLWRVPILGQDQENKPLFGSSKIP